MTTPKSRIKAVQQARKRLLAKRRATKPVAPKRPGKKGRR